MLSLRISKVDNSVEQLASAARLVASASCVVIAKLLVAATDSEVSHMLTLAAQLLAYFKESISLQLGKLLRIHPASPVQAIDVLTHHKLADVSICELSESHVRQGRFRLRNCPVECHAHSLWQCLTLLCERLSILLDVFWRLKRARPALDHGFVAAAEVWNARSS